MNSPNTGPKPYPCFDGDEDWEPPAYADSTYDMYLYSSGAELDEANSFSAWVDEVKANGAYGFEAARRRGQDTEIELVRETGEGLRLLNLSSYNYLGYAKHPQVMQAAKDAIDRYGIGACSSPVHGGTFEVHKELERELLDFIGLSGRGVSLFSSGYAVSTGTISALFKRGHYLVIDRSSHMSILEGAQISRAKILYFTHNDTADLRRVLTEVTAKEEDARILVCAEGVYSADGDAGPLREIVAAAKEHRALVLVDEAHSFLVGGPTGRGICEAEGVLADVDLLVLTFSKAFGGVGGALIARREITRYVNWYARCRMFSCAIDPAVTGGVLEALRLGRGSDGDVRRARVVQNAAFLRSKLEGHVDLGTSRSWIVTVLFGHDKLALPLFNFLQHHGLEGSILMFPAVNRHEGRIRLFVTSEHTHEQMAQAAEIVLSAARRFGFALNAPTPTEVRA
jgi:7-keto-8-aminopelargonate synthetase-like enzyme